MRKFVTTCVLMIVLAATATACSDGGSGGGFGGTGGGGGGGGGGKPSVDEIRSALHDYNVPERYADCIADSVHDKLSADEITSLRGGNDDTFSDLPSELRDKLQDIANDCASGDSGDSGNFDTSQGSYGGSASGSGGASAGTSSKPSRDDFEQELRDSGASSSEAACYTDELYDDLSAGDIDELRALVEGDTRISELPTSLRRKVLEADAACEGSSS